MLSINTVGYLVEVARDDLMAQLNLKNRVAKLHLFAFKRRLLSEFTARLIQKNENGGISSRDSKLDCLSLKAAFKIAAKAEPPTVSTFGQSFSLCRP